MVNFSVLVVFISFVLEVCKGQGISKDLHRCRQICYTKFVQDWHRCKDYKECKNICITPPNINNYIPEAFSFLCWNSCDETLGPFPLTVTSASRQGSLVLADIAWNETITNASKQCLVTWEVSGGGLMGNLLTDSSTVELSLWSDTTYHVQVTCKNKETGTMRRSNRLIVDTRKLNGELTMHSTISSSIPKFTSVVPTISLNANAKNLDDVFSTESLSSKGHQDRLRILKDSSRDKISETVTNVIKSEKTINHIPTVIRSKLTATNNAHISDIYSRSILFAMMGSLALFLGIVFIYILLRPSKDDPITLDKEELIRSEILPDTRTLHV